MKRETIYAQSTAFGKSAIATIRVSGNNCKKIIKKMTSIKVLKINKAILTNIYRVGDKQNLIDKGVVTYFKGPKSYTGEDILEISIHGGLAVCESIIRALSNSGLCRIAEAGEFTRRAHENNKMDLIQAEAVSDLINAETDSQRVQALKLIEGRLSSKIIEIINEIKKLLANSEANIDFVEDEIPKNLNKKIKEQNKNIIKKIDKLLNDNKIGERIRNGFKIAIIGDPNSGKSSLINYFATRDISIVSKIPGTTRDVIELNYDLNGLPVIFYDTAGIRKKRKNIEKIGINKAIERAKNSDINLVIIKNEKNKNKYIQFKNIIYVRSKTDLAIKRRKIINCIDISTKNGNGISKLKKEIYKKLIFSGKNLNNISVSRERHRKLIEKARKNLINSQKIHQTDMKAEEIRESLKNVSKIVGKYDIEEIYDIIFNEFCIGK